MHARRAAVSAGSVLIGLLSSGCEGKKAAAPHPPATVLVAPAERRDVDLHIEAVATLDGYVNAEIRARVKGFLKTQSYKDGSAVRAGQVLFTIESADYAAAVSVARAGVTRAGVAQAHNRVTVDRYQGLSTAGLLSKQDLDNATASLDDANGQLQSARAQLDQALLNLSYTQVRSPLDGVSGLASVRVGNLVGQDGPTLLTTVSQLDPMRVTFPLSESDYTRYRDRLVHLDQRDLAWAREQFASLEARGTTVDGDSGVELVLSDGSVYGHRGVIVAVNRQIDVSTGTIQVQALVPNAEGGLRPGAYGQVRLQRLQAGKAPLVVPEKALLSVQGTYSVGVVGEGNRVHLRRVELGPSAQAFRVILAGISEGDRVVVEGVQKIADGALVDPQPAPPLVPAGGAAHAPGATVAPIESAAASVPAPKN